MFSTDDTIVAIATPPGRGGLGVVRLSGPDARRIAGNLIGRSTPLEPRHATFGKLAIVTASSTADHVVVTVFAAPHSYTGEDVAEISAHGSPVILESILRSAMALGTRLAEPGEFTLRAFLNGKMDLVQAEAVADLVDAVTPLQARAAFDQLEGTLTRAMAAIEADLFGLMARLEASLDFPEEGYHFVSRDEGTALIARVIEGIDRLRGEVAAGRLIREGARVMIVGAPNVGKSSLFNALLNTDRAIVTATPGTTRDLVSETTHMCGVPVALVDSAGLRETADVVEIEGVARARGAMGVADLLLVVLDRSRPLSDDDRRLIVETGDRRRVVVMNKSDLAPAWSRRDISSNEAVLVSAARREGLDELRDVVVRGLLGGEPLRDRPAVTNVRHAALLEGARVSLLRCAGALAEGVPEEFVLSDLQEASCQLQEVTGRRTSEDLLKEIFSRFCIGK